MGGRRRVLGSVPIGARIKSLSGDKTSLLFRSQGLVSAKRGVVEGKSTLLHPLIILL